MATKLTHNCPEADGGLRGAALVLRCGIILGVFALVLGAILFLSAGGWDWLGAWAYIALFIIGGVVATPIIWRVNPEVVQERLHLRKAAGQEGDVRIGSVMMVFWVAGLAGAGLDRRFGWSPAMPPGAEYGALLVAGMGYVLAAWAMAVNKFFAWFVRVQKERGHMVVESGPYRFVRHPGYVGGLLIMGATPLILGSVLAFVPMGLAMGSLVIRTAMEDRSLREGLAGYRDYARKVPSRLVPGLW